jgi:hypothetical protein
VQLNGLPVDEVAVRLASTKPQPVADANRGLDPEERYKEVLKAERQAPGGVKAPREPR